MTLTKDWPHGYVDTNGCTQVVRYWGEDIIVTFEADCGEYAWDSESGHGLEDGNSGEHLLNAPAPKQSDVDWVVRWNRVTGAQAMRGVSCSIFTTQQEA